MRPLLLVLLLAGAAAAADWEATRKEFLERYRGAERTEERAKAIAELARADVAPAAQMLLSLWEGLERDARKRRKELAAIRARLLDVDAKLRAIRPGESPARAQRLRARRRHLVAAEQAADARLLRIDLEQVAILEGIRELGSPEAVGWLAREGLERARSPALLLAVATKVASSKGADTRALVDALGRVREPEHLVPILEALARGGRDPGPGVEKLVELLGHRDWTVRVAAAHALAAAARPEGVGPLVAALAEEKPRSRSLREMTKALQKLTGQGIGEFPDIWAKWWAANEEAVRAGEVPLGRGKPSVEGGQGGHFYGIPQRARRIIYVLDVSGSMQVSMRKPQWVEGRAVPARDDEESRLDAARTELLRAVKRLDRDRLYAVVTYASHVVPIHDELVPADDRNLARLKEELAYLGASGSTNIYAALEHALRMAGVHPDERGKQVADAIYLVSDGSPTTSKGETEDPERTLLAVRRWNAEKRVEIHTIGIGREHSRSFMRTLASENGGTYRAVVPGKK